MNLENWDIKVIVYVSFLQISWVKYIDVNGFVDEIVDFIKDGFGSFFLIGIV